MSSVFQELKSVMNKIRTLNESQEDHKEAITELQADRFDYRKYIYQNSSLNINTGLKVVYLNGDTTGMNKDTKVTLDWEFDGMSGSCTVKWQGSSSLAWPKKNYSLKLSEKADWGSSMGRSKWGAQKKYVLKANYNDFSQGVYMCAARLWGEIVKARGEENVPVEMWNSLNYGAVDGFPVMLVINGKYIGLYMCMTHKEITTGVEKVNGYYLMGEISGVYTSAASFRGHTSEELLKSEYDLSVVNVPDEDDLSAVVESFNNCVDAVKNTHKNWQTELEEYLDVNAAFDYYIFRCLLGDGDGSLKNQGLICYNGKKWHHTVYDLDHCFGASGTGAYHGNPETNHWQIYPERNRVWYLIDKYSRGDLRERYHAMREGVLREAHVYDVLANYINDIPFGLLIQEDKLWPHTPNTSTARLHQIIEWYRLRCKWCDNYIDSLVK